jgi:hypothetical protein
MSHSATKKHPSPPPLSFFSDKALPSVLGSWTGHGGDKEVQLERSGLSPDFFFVSLLAPLFLIPASCGLGLRRERVKGSWDQGKKVVLLPVMLATVRRKGDKGRKKMVLD